MKLCDTKYFIIILILLLLSDIYVSYALFYRKKLNFFQILYKNNDKRMTKQHVIIVKKIATDNDSHKKFKSYQFTSFIKKSEKECQNLL